ncbi:MAG: RNA polymerase sigma-70 factor [Paludibacter sp.]|nr:RNA polymerase sigma-70 factor [Paludibacter sp.]
MKSSGSEKHINPVKLLSRMARNEQSAFEEFYNLYYSRLYKYVCFYVHDEDIRKDLISDVFVNVWHNRTNMDKVLNMDNYLFISVRNRALKHIKESNQRNFIQIDEISESVAIENVGPEQVLINRELHDLIEKAINNLPERCRLIFTLIRGEKKTYKEVAKILSISEKTVHAQMCIAVKKLGLIIKQYM